MPAEFFGVAARWPFLCNEVNIMTTLAIYRENGELLEATQDFETIEGSQIARITASAGRCRKPG